MGDLTATFSNPKQNYTGAGGLSAAVPVTRAKFKWKFGEISNCTVRVDHDVFSKYMLETNDTTNPMQLNSQLAATFGGATIFRGRVDEKPVSLNIGGRRVLQAVCSGKEANLVDALIPDASGNVLWSLATSTFEVGSGGSPYLPLLPVTGGDYGTFTNDTIWPDPADTEGAKCYIEDAGSPTDTLDAGINGATAAPFYIELSTTNQGMAAQGWLRVESGGSQEWMYYEGYDPTGGGGKYRLQIISRGQLGTAQQSYLAGTSVWNKTPKVIGPEATAIYHDPAGGTSFTTLRDREDYMTQHTLGCYVLTVADAGSSSYAGNYHVYDEDQSLDGGSTLVYIEDVIAAIMKAPWAYGGAGWVDGNLNLDASGIIITRYDYDPDGRAVYAWAAIQELLNDLNLQAEWQVWYDHQNDDMRFGLIANAGTADYSFAHVESIEQTASIKDLYSAIRVKHTYDQDANLIQPQYSHHPDYGSGPGVNPIRWRYTTSGGASWNEGDNTTLESPAAQNGQFGFDALVDGKLDTKLQAEWDAQNPGASIVFSDHWFSNASGGGTPTTITLDEIEMHCNAYRVLEGWSRSYVNDDNTYFVSILAAADATVSSGEIASATWKQLGYIKGTPGVEASSVELKITDFVLRDVNAIRIQFDYMAGPQRPGDYYWAAVHLLRIIGNVTKYQLVQTSDDAGDKTDPSFLYVPNTHEKLRGGLLADSAAGSPLARQVSIGAASDAAAKTIGRAWLEASIIKFLSKNYTYAGTLDAVPILGKTAEFDETNNGSPDYTGVLREIELDYTGGRKPKRTLSMMATDYSSSDVA